MSDDGPLLPPLGDSYKFYRLIEDKEYNLLTDEDFAKLLSEMNVPTNVAEWLVNLFKKETDDAFNGTLEAHAALSG